MRRIVIPLFILLCLPLQALAQKAPNTAAIMDALRIGEVLDIIAEESLVNAQALDDSMLQGQGGAGWNMIVASIHDTGYWETQMREVVETELSPDHVAAIEGFLTSEQGARIIELELSARRALLDSAIEEISQQRLAELQAADAPLLELVQQFIDANDLIDSNVVGALNANVAFLEGLQDGTDGAAGDIFGDVWAQEPEIRESTRDWLLAYLSMAYAPLASGDLEAYIALSESPAGQAFNTAIFAAFDKMFVDTSRATGLALGRMMAAEDI